MSKKVLVQKQAELGEYGSASVELDSMAVVTANVQVKVDLIAELEKLALQTDTKLDEQVVAYIKQLVTAANAVL